MTSYHVAQNLMTFSTLLTVRRSAFYSDVMTNYITALSRSQEKMKSYFPWLRVNNLVSGSNTFRDCNHGGKISLVFVQLWSGNSLNDLQLTTWEDGSLIFVSPVSSSVTGLCCDVCFGSYCHWTFRCDVLFHLGDRMSFDREISASTNRTKNAKFAW